MLKTSVVQIVQCVHLYVLFVQGDCLTVLDKLQGLLVCWGMSMHRQLVAERQRCGAVYMPFCARGKG